MVLTILLQALIVLQSESMSILMIGDADQIYQIEYLHFLFDQLSNQFDLQFTVNLSKLDVFLQETHPEIIISLSQSLITFHQIRDYADSNNVIFFCPSLPISQQNAYELLPQISQSIQALEQFLNFINWDNFTHIGDVSSLSQVFADHFRNRLSYQSITLSDDMNYETLLNYIGRSLKANGQRLFVLTLKNQMIQRVKQGLIDKKMWRKGIGVVCFSDFVSGEAFEGEIQIMPSMGVGKESLEEVLFQSFIEMVGISEENDRQLRSLQALKLYLESKYPLHRPEAHYSIFNYYSRLQLAGVISNVGISMFETLVYPGNPEDLLAFNKFPIDITISSSSKEPPPNPSYSQRAYTYYGSYYSIELINQNTRILPQFQIIPREVQCGQYVFDYEYAIKCLGEYPLGIAHIAPYGTSVAAQFSMIQLQLGYEIPMITSIPLSDSLNDPKQFPNLMSDLISIDYGIWSQLRMLILKGWKNMGFVFSDTPFTRISSEQLFSFASLMGINIVVKSEDAFLSLQATDEDIRAYVKKIIKSRVRLIGLLLEVEHIEKVLKEMYRQGLRRGDVIFISFGFYLSSFFQVGLLPYDPELLELAYYSIYGSLPSYVSEDSKTFFN